MMEIVAQFVNEIAFAINGESAKNVEKKFNEIAKKAKKILGALGIGLSLRELNAIAEQYEMINRKLTASLGSQEAVKEAQDKILQSANACRTEYSQMVDAVLGLKNANENVFPLDDAIKFTEAVTKLGKASGMTDGQISQIQGSFKSMATTGRMQLGEVMSLMSSAPGLVDKLCESLGVSELRLKTMAQTGRLTAATIKNALLSCSDDIDKAFANTNMTISEGMTVISNGWKNFVEETNEMFDITNTVAHTMVNVFERFLKILTQIRNGVVWVTDKMGGLENALKLITIVAAAAWVAINFEKITTLIKSLKNVGDLIGKINFKLLAIIAVITLIVLIIDDFIHFMKGDNSVIGEVLQRAGIDADEARKTITEAFTKVKDFLINVWTTISGFLTKVWGTIKEGAQKVFEAFSQWWAENGEELKQSWSVIWEQIQVIASKVWGFIQTAATTIFGALKTFWDQWGSTILALFENFWNTLAALVDPFLSALQAIIDFIANVFTGNWEGAWNALKDLVGSIWEIIVTLITGAWERIKIIWDGVVGFFQEIFQGVWDTVSEKITGIKDTIVEGFQAAIDWITGLPEQALQWGADIIQAIIDGITGAVGGMVDAVSGIAETIADFLGFSVPEKGPLSDFDTYMPDMIDLMTEGMENGKPKISKKAQELAAEVSEPIADAYQGEDGDESTATVTGGGRKGRTTQASSAANTAGARSDQVDAILSMLQQIGSLIQKVFSTIQSTVSRKETGKDVRARTTNSDAILMAIGQILGLLEKGFDAVRETMAHGIEAILGRFAAGAGPTNGTAGEEQRETERSVNMLASVIKNVGGTIVSKSSEYLAGIGEMVKDGFEKTITLADNRLDALSRTAADILTNITNISDWLQAFTLMFTLQLPGNVSENLGLLQAMLNPSPSTINNTATKNAIRNINQNVNINNTFNGERSVQQEASEAMDKSTRNIAGDLAWALNYT